MTHTFRHWYSRTVRGMDVDEAFDVTYQINPPDTNCNAPEYTVEVCEVTDEYGKPIPSWQYDSLEDLFETAAYEHMDSLPCRDEVAQ